jgi:hypothetical protein
MTVSLKHVFTSGIADSGDITLVQPSNWNAEHTLTLAQGNILGRLAAAGTGAATEIPLSFDASNNATFPGQVNLVAGTTSIAPLDFASGSLLTSANAGAIEYDGKVIYATPQGSQRGIIPGMQYLRLESTVNGLNSNAVQPTFPNGTSTASSISGTTLTIGGTITGTFAVGQYISASGITAGTYITALGTGTGGAGTYTVNNSQTIASTTIISSYGVTLSSSTIYKFQAEFNLYKATGTTSHTVSMLFGGSATINSIYYTVAIATGTATQSNFIDTAVAQAVCNQATATVINSNSSTALISRYYVMSGIVSINSGGTFIPLYQMSAAPGNFYSTVLNSSILVYPIGASGATNRVGTWA